MNLLRLDRDSLNALAAVAEYRNFTRAARSLYLSQPALSKRIAALEASLGVVLVARSRAGATLTPGGFELLRCSRSMVALEDDVYRALGLASGDGFAGIIRIAGFSSIVRSRLLERIAVVARGNPTARVHVFTREVHELELMLSRGEVDIIVTLAGVAPPPIEIVEIGVETNVLVESRRWRPPADVFLDHDPSDDTSLRYAAKHRLPIRERLYFDEVYCLVDAAAYGLGRAVLPKHLVAHDKRLKVLDRYAPMKDKVFAGRLRSSAVLALQRPTLSDLIFRSLSSWMK